jgi:putative membrane protein
MVIPHQLLALGTLLGLVSIAPAAEPEKARPEYGNPGFANPDTPGLMAGKPGDASNTVDVVFLKQLAIGSRAEVELGKLAGERGELDAVDQFGKHMVDDHSAANSKLAGVARSAGVDLPKDLDAEHEAARRELAALSGSAFDLRYIDSQIKDHQAAVQLLIHEIGSGQSARVKDFAAQTLPTVMQHLEMARGVHDQLTGLAPQAPLPTAPK